MGHPHDAEQNRKTPFFHFRAHVSKSSSGRVKYDKGIFSFEILKEFCLIVCRWNTRLRLKIKHFSRSILKFKYIPNLEKVKIKHYSNFQNFVLHGNLGGENMAVKVLGNVNARTTFLARKTRLAIGQGVTEGASHCSYLMPLRLNSRHPKINWWEWCYSWAHVPTLVGACFQELGWLPVESRVA